MRNSRHTPGRLRFGRGVSLTRTDGKSGPNATFILIVVASVVGGIILLAIAYTCIRRIARRSHRPAPLPPVQPLAHQRERQLSQYFSDSRPSTWYAQQRPPAFASAVGSDASLIPHTASRERLASTPSPSRQGSADDGTLTTPSSEAHQMPELTAPSRQFGQSQTYSSSSLGSNESRMISPPPETPSSSGSNAPLFPRTRRSSSGGVRSVHSRPVSMASSVSTVRGAPHGPHSNVQIVLPVPLAPGLNPYYTGRSASGGDVSMNRHSIVDAWASVAVSAMDAPEVPRERRRRSTSQPADLRRSASSSTTSSAQSSRRSREKTRSINMLTKSGSASSTSTSPHPPVPRIPAQYTATSAAAGPGAQLAGIPPAVSSTSVSRGRPP